MFTAVLPGNKITRDYSLNADMNNPIRKTDKVKKRLTELFSNSSAIGLAHIFRSNSKTTKLIWLAFLIASSCTCAYFTISSITDYLRFKTVTTISVINERQAQFPTISFCLFPYFNQSLDKIIISSEFERVNIINYSKTFETFNHAVYGKCFRFNSGKNVLNETIPIQNSTPSGLTNKFNMKLNLKSSGDYDFAELLVNIHNHSSKPFYITKDSFWLRAGSINYFSLERVFTEQLGEPYNLCLKNVSLFKKNKTLVNYILNSKRTYSQSDCFYLCSLLFALEKSNCSCVSTLDDFEEKCSKKYGIDFFNVENSENVSQCIEKYLIEFRIKDQYEKCQNYCPMECDSMSYSITPYSESLPTSGNISKISKEVFELGLYNTYEEVNRNYISLKVFYKNLQYTLIKEVPNTETFNFISNTGGILGLFLGISFLSFIEIIEMLIEISLILFEDH